MRFLVYVEGDYESSSEAADHMTFEIDHYGCSRSAEDVVISKLHCLVISVQRMGVDRV